MPLSWTCHLAVGEKSFSAINTIDGKVEKAINSTLKWNGILLTSWHLPYILLYGAITMFFTDVNKKKRREEKTVSWTWSISLPARAQFARLLRYNLWTIILAKWQIIQKKNCIISIVARFDPFGMKWQCPCHRLGNSMHWLETKTSCHFVMLQNLSKLIS